MMSPAALTPDQCDEVMVWKLRRYAQLTHPKGTRRKTDAPHILIKKYNAKGQRVA